MNNRKRFLWIAGFLITALIVIALLKRNKSDKFKVTTATVVSQTIAETVIANGKIQPETEVVISSEVSGKILDLPFKEGDKVLEGDLLVKINPDLAQAALDRAEAGYNNTRANKANAEARLLQAEAQFKNSQIVYNRNQRLLSDGAISQAEFDNVEASYQTAEAEVMAAKQSVKAAEYSMQSALAGVREARDSYSRTTIYAPMTGTISKLNVEVGEQVVGAMQMTGTEIMRVANLEVMEVLADVNESEIVRVHFGDTASIEVDAYIDRSFNGIVTEIANSANSQGVSADQVTNFEVKIRILEESYEDILKDENPDFSPFRPGMNATVDIQTARKTNVLAVPLESVTSRADTSSSEEVSGVDRLMGSSVDDSTDESFTCVFVLDGEKVRLKVVSTGIQDDTNIEILSGLESGETVISGPFDLVSRTLVQGDEVKVVSKEDLYKEE